MRKGQVSNYNWGTNRDLDEELFKHQCNTMYRRDIAEYYGVAKSTVDYWARKRGIAQRKHSRGRSPKTSNIPSSVFAPILQKLLDEHEVNYEGVKHDGGNGWRGSKAEVICSTMNENNYVSPRRFSAILTEETPNVRWTTVDRLLVAFGRPELWHTDRTLREYYWEGHERPEGLDAIVEGLVQMHSTAKAA